MAGRLISPLTNTVMPRSLKEPVWLLPHALDGSQVEVRVTINVQNAS